MRSWRQGTTRRQVAPVNNWPDVEPGLVILIVAFVAILVVGFGSPLLSRLTTTAATTTAEPPPYAAYDLSLRAAAIKQPDQRISLQRISPTATAVDVVTFTSSPAPPTDKRTFDIWVSLPSELKAACTGATDPVHRLQEILGLPPVAAPNGVVRQMSLAPDGLFRPCISGNSVSDSQCDFDVPPPPDPADPAAVAKAYDQMRFVYNQMVTSYRIGFVAAGRKPPDYPYTGYPFTGMGWTYDWGPTPTHVGVSEFVIRRDAPVTLGPVLTPAEFCASAK